MMQLTLLSDKDKSKELVYLPLDQLTISPFNPRRIRGKDAITRLAERINRNGFEITRALWVYKNDTGYSVMAGGTRLQAAEMAGVKEVPCVLHTGYSDVDIVRLANEDNENDEYHEPVSLVDEWLHCLQLSEDGWTQQRIADAKGIRQAIVSQRIQLAKMTTIHPHFIKNGNLKEGHARALLLCNNADWLPRDVAAVEVLDNVLKRSKAPTANKISTQVQNYNEFIELAEGFKNSLSEAAQQDLFIEQLIESAPRSKGAVKGIIERFAQELKNSLEQQAQDLAEAAKGPPIDLYHGDMLEILPTLGGYDLIVTDPPYGVTNYDWDIINTRTWLEQLINNLNDQFNIFWFCSPHYAADTELIFRELDLPIQSRIIWHRRNMSMGSKSKYKFIDTWEMILHAGNRALNFPDEWSEAWFDVQTHAVPQTNFADVKLHPTQKPIELIARLIEFGSYPGDKILDPFAGSGTAGDAIPKDRFITLIEQSEEYIKVIQNRLGVIAK